MALRVWLPLNGNLDNQGLSELTPINHNCTIANGKIGQCYSFDGSTSYIDIGSACNEIIKGYGQPFTLAFWIKSLENGTRGILFSTFPNTGNTNFLSLEENSGSVTSNALRFDWKQSYDAYVPDMFDVNQWVHVSIAYDGDQNIYIYKNGALKQTLVHQLETIEAHTKNFWLGNDPRLGGTSFEGFMNDFRIYDECLSPKQVKEISKGLCAHYKLEGVGANANLATNSFTTSPSSFYDYTGKASASRITDNEVCTSVYKIDFPEDTATYSNYNLYTGIPRDASAVTQDGKTYTLSFKIKASKALSNYKLLYEYNNSVVNIDIGTKWQKVTMTGVANNQYSALYVCHGGRDNRLKINGGSLYIAEIKLELGDKATDWIPNEAENEYIALGYDKVLTTDVSGFGYNGTITGELTFDSDSPRYAGSTKFNGSSYITTTPGSLAWCNFDNLTISAWMKPTVKPGGWTGSIGIQQDGGTNGKVFSISNYAGNFSVHTDNGSGWVTTQSEALPLNQWSHCVATLTDGTNLKMYINGKLVKTATINYNTATVSSDTRIAIGVDLPGDDEKYTGSYSDVRFYSTALSAEDILKLYEISGIIDNKGNTYSYEFIEED